MIHDHRQQDSLTCTVVQDEAEITDRLLKFVQTHGPVFVLTGAGCSTDSGIPDYRDDTGQWKHTPPILFNDFLKSEIQRKRYWARSLAGWPHIDNARPNKAHYALARLERAGYIQNIVTQNVDRLHQKAGSDEVVDLHGRADRISCLGCGVETERALFQQKLSHINDFRTQGFTAAPDGDAVMDIESDTFVVPSCEYCGGVLKPSVVFFGESVPKSRLNKAFNLLGRSAGILIVGSSLQVYSGFRFFKFAQQQQKPIAILNRGATRADTSIDCRYAATCGPILESMATALKI